MRIEFTARLRFDPAVGNGDGFEAAVAAGPGGFQCVFDEDGRFVVGEGDAAAVLVCGQLRDSVRRGRVSVQASRAAQMVVLTEVAREIAADCAEGKNAAAGQKVVQRFFFDRIDGESAGQAERVRNQFAAVISSAETEAAFAVGDSAMPGAESAFDEAGFDGMPITRCFHNPLF